MRVYVDSNVVIDLWDHKRAKEIPSAPHLRADDVEQFFAVSQSAGVQLVLSPLLVQEVYHYLWRARLEPLRDSYKCKNEKKLRSDYPAAYTAGVKAARHEANKAISHARNYGAVLRFPALGGTEHRWGSVAEAMFFTAIEKCDGLNAMDSLHLAFAVLLRCTHFASSDRDFVGVSGLLLLSR